MKDNILISVIIPVYNTAPYLVECMESIINQTFKDIEIICINDGSTDGSLDILNQYTLNDERVQVISQENCGLSRARNRGLEVAQGDYIYFMDSDDTLKVEALEYLYGESAKNQLEVLCFDGQAVYETEELKDKYPSYHTTYKYERTEELGEIYSGIQMLSEFRRIEGYRVAVWLHFYTKEFLDTNNLRFCEGIYHEDEVFTFQCMMSAKRMSHRHKVYFNRRVRENSIMTKDISEAHVYGCLSGYLQILFMAMKSRARWESNLVEEAAIVQTLNNRREMTKSQYRKLKDISKLKMSEQITQFEEYILEEHILNDIAELKKCKSRLERLENWLEKEKNRVQIEKDKVQVEKEKVQVEKEKAQIEKKKSEELRRNLDKVKENLANKVEQLQKAQENVTCTKKELLAMKKELQNVDDELKKTR